MSIVKIPLLTYQPTKVAFVFSWAGSQHPKMGKMLAETRPAFRQFFDQYLSVVTPYGFGSQPYFTAFQMALGDFWKSLGVVPDACLGQGVGHIAAAYHDGLLTEQEALKLSIYREEAINTQQNTGGMLECSATHDIIDTLIAQHPGLATAMINDPFHTIVSGKKDALQHFEQTLQTQSIHYRYLNTTIPLNSPCMADAAKGLEHICASMTSERIDAAVWANCLTSTDMFMRQFQELLDHQFTHFLEISPHPSLHTAMACNLKHANKSATLIASLMQNREDDDCINDALTELQSCNLMDKTEPMTALEDLIKTIWKIVLHRENISIYDNFFELGGTKHHAKRIVQKLEHLEITLPIETLMTEPTIKSLANVVKESCLIT